MQHILLLLLNLLFCHLIAGIRSPVFIPTPQRRSDKLKWTTSVSIHHQNHLDVLAQHMKEAATTSHQHLRSLSSEALLRATTMARSITSSPSFPHYIAGIAAGILECLVGHPLDTIRVRIITAGTGTSGGSGMLRQLRHVFTEPNGGKGFHLLQGIRSLYRGTKSELLSSAVAGALLFGVNDYLKRLARGDNMTASATGHNDDDDDDDHELVTGPLLFAAAGTGFLDGITSKPLEMLKLRQQILPTTPLDLPPLSVVEAIYAKPRGLGLGNSGPLAHASAFVTALTQGWTNHHPANVLSSPDVAFIDGVGLRQSLRSLVREEGFGTLFRGWLPTVLRESLGNAAFFAAYHHTKNTLSRRQSTGNEKGRDKVDKSSDPSVKSHRAQSTTPVKSELAQSNLPVKSDTSTISSTGAILLAGAMAGLAYTLCSHPLEMAAILMQSDIPRKRVIRTDTAMRTVLEYRYNQGMLQCLKDVWHSGTSSLTCSQPLQQPLNLMLQGISSLYRGAWPSVLRALPSYAASFWGYEATLSLLEKQQRQYLLTLPPSRPQPRPRPHQPLQQKLLQQQRQLQHQPQLMHISSSPKLEKPREYTAALRLHVTHPILDSTPSLSLLASSSSSSSSLLSPSSKRKDRG